MLKIENAKNVSDVLAILDSFVKSCEKRKSYGLNKSKKKKRKKNNYKP